MLFDYDFTLHVKIAITVSTILVLTAPTVQLQSTELEYYKSYDSTQPFICEQAQEPAKDRLTCCSTVYTGVLSAG